MRVFLCAVTVVVSVSACSTHAPPLDLVCTLRAGAAKREVDLATSSGTHSQTVLGIAGPLHYVVSLSVLRVDPAVRVRVALSIAGDARGQTNFRAGDLRPVFSGSLHPPGRTPSFPRLRYACYPPVG